MGFAMVVLAPIRCCSKIVNLSIIQNVIHDQFEHHIKFIFITNVMHVVHTHMFVFLNRILIGLEVNRILIS